MEDGDTGGHVVKPGHCIHGCLRAGGVIVEFSYAVLSNKMILRSRDWSSECQ